MIRCVGLCLLITVLVALRTEPVVDNFYCTAVASHLDCSTYQPWLQCGTDRITYNNMCEFSKAHCKNTNLHLAHTGKCHTGTTGTLLNGSEIAHILFCEELRHIACPPSNHVVCASNHVTYNSVCEFDKARCIHLNLIIMDLAPCK